MTEINIYLNQILQKYNGKDILGYSAALSQLHTTLITWASSCYVNLLDSGSRAKGTAISLASDVDYVVSLTSGCNDNNGGLKACYDSLFTKLNIPIVIEKHFSAWQNVRHGTETERTREG